MALKFGEEEFIDLELIDDADDGQTRANTREHVVADYAADLEAGDEFPAILLVKVGESDDYRVADGYHRIRSHRRVGREKIKARVAPGSARQAFLYGATEANKKNSERLSRADKRRRASIVLNAPEYAHLRDNDSALARLIGCSHTAVANYRSLPLGMPTVAPPEALREGQRYWFRFDDGAHGTRVEYAAGRPCYITSHDDSLDSLSISWPDHICRRWDAEEFCGLLRRGLGRPEPWRLVGWGEMSHPCWNTPEQRREWLSWRQRLFTRRWLDTLDDPEAAIEKLQPKRQAEAREALADRSLDAAVTTG